MLKEGEWVELTRIRVSEVHNSTLPLQSYNSLRQLALIPAAQTVEALNWKGYQILHEWYNLCCVFKYDQTRHLKCSSYKLGGWKKGNGITLYRCECRAT